MKLRMATPARAIQRGSFARWVSALSGLAVGFN
jgi:hypothetical protein